MQKKSYVWRKAVRKESEHPGGTMIVRSKRSMDSKVIVADTAWKEFLTVYERFTDVLCAAAKNGCNEAFENDFQCIRCWINAEYYRVSSRLRPYLEGLSADSWNIRQVTAAAGRCGFRRADIIDLIFKIQTLREIFDTDNGDLIERISLLSDAVYRCDAERR